MNTGKPFYHTHIETKKFLIKLGRDYYNKSQDETLAQEESLAYKFASALLYMNYADYIAQWFAFSIQQVSADAVKEFYFEQISFEKVSTKDINIGQAIRIIKKYNFANKQNLIELLEKIDKSRNEIAHTLLKKDPSKLEEIDRAVESLKADTEELIAFTDRLKIGMPPRNMREVSQASSELVSS